jgi:hypothetical protein
MQAQMEAQQRAAAAAAQAQQPPAAAPAQGGGTSMDDKIDALQRLGELKSAGVLTDEEFAIQKAKILAS